MMGRLLLVVPILLSCSSYEQDKSSKMYNPEMSKAGDIYVSSPIIQDPATALVLGGIGLAANPEYYKSTAISGKCSIIPDKEALIQIPCKEDVQIVLRDSKGKEVARSTPQSGEFAFRVNKNDKYQLTVDTQRFVLTNENLKSLGIGDSVVVKLKKKKPGN